MKAAVMLIMMAGLAGCGPDEIPNPAAPTESADEASAISSNATAAAPQLELAEAAKKPATGVGDIFEGAPPAPEGYASETAIQLALVTNQLELIDGSAPKELPETIRLHADVEYGNVDAHSLLLDIYEPTWLAQSEALAPVIVFVHGGAWSGGEKAIMRYYCVKFAEQGYVTATVGYRLSGVATFPAAVDDVRNAVEYLKNNAGQYHIDPESMALVGSSAGGHLVMTVGFSANESNQPYGENQADLAESIDAIVNFYGPTDLTKPFAQNHKAVIQFLGASYEENPEVFGEASPVSYLDADDPPTLILHGTIDSVVPIDQADLLYDQMNTLGIDVYYDRMEGYPHAMDIAAELNVRFLYLMTNFFEKYVPLPKTAPKKQEPTDSTA